MHLLLVAGNEINVNKLIGAACHLILEPTALTVRKDLCTINCMHVYCYLNSNRMGTNFRGWLNFAVFEGQTAKNNPGEIFVRLRPRKNMRRRWARQARECRSFVNFVQPLTTGETPCVVFLRHHLFTCSLIHEYQHEYHHTPEEVGHSYFFMHSAAPIHGRFNPSTRWVSRSFYVRASTYWRNPSDNNSITWPTSSRLIIRKGRGNYTHNESETYENLIIKMFQQKREILTLRNFVPIRTVARPCSYTYTACI